MKVVSTTSSSPAVSVVIVTYERPDYLDQCLHLLSEQLVSPREVIVVDASVSDESRRVSQRWGFVTYIANPAGRGNMSNSRNVGWRSSTSDIVAFIDDDAFAASDWLAHLVAAYQDEMVGGVGGRAVRSEFDVPRDVECVGLLTPRGELVANFDARTRDGVDASHLIGCNMSFRRALLERVEGFREDYPGTEVREETDLCFRIIEEGFQLRYEPSALVVHVGGPYVRGHRFDVRYDYYAARNHAQLLVRHFGIGAPIVRGFIGGLAGRTARESARSFFGSFLRAGARLVGLIAGLRAGLRTQDGRRFDPRRMYRGLGSSEQLEASARQQV